MKTIFYFSIIALALLLAGFKNNTPDEKTSAIQFVEIGKVKINDPFWSPKLKQWSTVTANDVLDKFEGKHIKEAEQKPDHDAFANFDAVARGDRGTGKHAGPPWYDGLVYETIRGIADQLILYPDKQLESRIDRFVNRIEAAQKSDPEGYLNTYTQLMEPDHRWGDNGGMLRWQHDVYNAGMLIEAGVHYYQSTGKVKLLEVATRFANHMCGLMGPAPKRNIVPSHSGPEEPMIKLFWLYKNNPGLKDQLDIPVDAQAYWNLATFWIENRGNNCGYPLWLTWGNNKAEQWIRDQEYKAPRFCKGTRPTWGDYAQDSISVFEQKTIEGHAVRATLLATGIAAAALENRSAEYIRTASDLWDNMVGKRMFITGGVGAVHHDEKFGPDYFLPTGAYLETCAAVGAGFFSQRMNELTNDGKYMDEFERVMYNNVITGISLSGVNYTYQNPLNSDKHARWEWDGCPCCPPMFLKSVSAMPGYIYAYDPGAIYVNLFIGSETVVPLTANNRIRVKQETRYPWEGTVAVGVDPEKKSKFSLRIRIPGWAQGVENPYGLYTSGLAAKAEIKVNGKPVAVNPVDGYVSIDREWSKGDKITLNLPMHPRIVTANDNVRDLENLVSIASGPIVYCLEKVDNEGLDHFRLDVSAPLQMSFESRLLNGVNVIKGKAKDGNKEVGFQAVPFYAIGNRQVVGYKVWLPKN